jgi:uncharacterized protein (DUF1778 family)
MYDAAIYTGAMKDATIIIRVSADEKAEMQAAAARDERALSDWVRRAALGAARRPVFIGKDE